MSTPEWEFGAQRFSAMYFDDGCRLVEQQADVVTGKGYRDCDTGRVHRDEFHLVGVNPVRDTTDGVKIVGSQSRRHTVIVVEGNHCRVEHGQRLR